MHKVRLFKNSANVITDHPNLSHRNLTKMDTRVPETRIFFSSILLEINSVNQTFNFISFCSKLLSVALNQKASILWFKMVDFSGENE